MSSVPTIYMDACCFIDLAKSLLKVPVQKEREPHLFFCRKFIEASRKGDAVVYTSTITVVECVKADDASIGNVSNSAVDEERVKALFKGMLMSAKSGVLPVMPTIAIIEAARDLRWNHGITCKPMDALHIATARAMKCGHFITTDKRIGAENITKLAALGLAVCSADSIADLLPSEYRQLAFRATKDEARPQAGG